MHLLPIPNIRISGFVHWPTVPKGLDHVFASRHSLPGAKRPRNVVSSSFSLWPQRSQDVSLAQEGALSLPPPPLIRVGKDMPSHDDDAPVPARRRKKKYHSGQEKGNSAPVSSSFRVRPYSPFLTFLSATFRIANSGRDSFLPPPPPPRERERWKERRRKGKIRFRLSISHAHLLKKRNSPTFTRRAEKSFFTAVLVLTWITIFLSIWWIPHPRLPKGWWWLSSGLFRWWSRKRRRRRRFLFPLSFSPSAFILSSLTPFERKKKRPHFPFSVWKKKKIEGTFLDTKKLLKTSTSNVIWHKSSYCAAVYFPLSFWG